MINFRELVDAGVHFGHQTARWNPRMKHYIWGKRNDIYLIDVSTTAKKLEEAAVFVKGVVESGRQVLWLGTKKPAQKIIESVAAKTNMPYVNHRWVGGTLSNNTQVRRSVTRLLHLKDVVSRAEEYPHYTKKELNVMRKSIERLEKNIGGISNLRWPVGALIVVDVTKELSAIKEASSQGVPVIALVDTNGDPSLVDFVIPGNDDTPRSIEIILNYLASAVEAGRLEADKASKSARVQKENEAIAKAKAAAGQVVPPVEQAAVELDIVAPLIAALAEEEEATEEKPRRTARKSATRKVVNEDE